MAKYSQARRHLAVDTKLGSESLLLVGLRGRETISQLFRFELDMLADLSTPVDFHELVGQPISVSIARADGRRRHIHGIVSRLRQGKRDDQFTHFQAEMVPKFWLYTKRIQCRIFQQKTVPQILQEMLAGLAPDLSIQIQGQFQPRDYCVQYLESDFAFASRLMEDEGIYYYFEHSPDSTKLCLGNNSSSCPHLDGHSVHYDPVAGGTRTHARIHDWSKTQEHASGSYTLWDHCFELPGQNLEARHVIPDTVAVGKVSHQLQLGNQDLEVFDYPGGFAGRFDGVNTGGSDESSNLQHIFQDNLRTTRIRMEEQAARAVVINGAGNHAEFAPGYLFSLERHYDGDGAYLLTEVEHEAQLEGYRSGQEVSLSYNNRFACLPAGLPFRPPRETSKPRIYGGQTATVVANAPGEEIFCDKYGRVKVQFHWDRHGRHNAQSSCWVRVGQAWAGKLFGGIYIPRVGQEVIINFLEGDPDEPMIIGSVYNAAQMPPLELPRYCNHSGFRSRTVGSGKGVENYHEIRFDDTDGSESLYLHSENYLHQEAEERMTHFVGWGQRGGSGSGGGGDSSGNGSAHTDQATGSGWGGGSGAPKWFQAIDGHGFEGTWGNKGEVVFGDSVELVVGENVEAVAGINGDFVIGADVSVVAGLSIDALLGPRVEFTWGPTMEWIYGDTYECVNGNTIEVYDGDYIEIINGGDLLTTVNGWVIEWIKGHRTAKLPAAQLKALEHSVEAFSFNPGGGAITGFPGIVAGLAAADAGAGNLEGQITAMSGQNPIEHEEVYKHEILLAYENIDMTSSNGDVTISALGAGKKIILQADEIEILSNKITISYETGSGSNTGVARLALDKVAAQPSFMATKADILKKEYDIIKEAVEIVEKEGKNALHHVKYGTAMIVFLVVIIALVAALLGVSIWAQTHAKYGSD